MTVDQFDCAECRKLGRFFQPTRRYSTAAFANEKEKEKPFSPYYEARWVSPEIRNLQLIDSFFTRKHRKIKNNKKVGVKKMRLDTPSHRSFLKLFFWITGSLS